MVFVKRIKKWNSKKYINGEVFSSQGQLRHKCDTPGAIHILLLLYN